jgi:hypothetical protein
MRNRGLTKEYFTLACLGQDYLAELGAPIEVTPHGCWARVDDFAALVSTLLVGVSDYRRDKAVRRLISMGAYRPTGENTGLFGVFAADIGYVC